MRIAFLKGRGKQEFWKTKDVPSHQLCLHVNGPSFVWSSWRRLPCISRINHLTFQSVFIYYFTSSSQHPLPLSKNNYFPLRFIDPEWLIAWSTAQWTQQLQPFPIKPGSYWHLIRLTPPLHKRAADTLPQRACFSCLSSRAPSQVGILLPVSLFFSAFWDSLSLSLSRSLSSLPSPPCKHFFAVQLCPLDKFYPRIHVELNKFHPPSIWHLT